MAHDYFAGRIFDLRALVGRIFAYDIAWRRVWPLALAMLFAASAAIFACLPFSQSSQPQSPQSLAVGAGGSGFSTFGGRSSMAMPGVAAAFEGVQHGAGADQQAAPSWLGFKKGSAGLYQSRSE